MKGNITLFMNNEPIRRRVWYGKTERKQIVAGWKELIKNSKYKFHIIIQITDYGENVFPDSD